MVKRIFLREDESYEPAFLLVAIILFVIVVFLMFGKFGGYDNSGFSSLFCGDGTLNGACSINKKPFFCSDGILVEKASVCGCPSSTVIKGDSCISVYEGNPVNASFKYVLRGENKTINVTLYGEMADYILTIPREISYANGEIPSREDFKLRKLNEENQRQLLLPLVIQIQNLNKDKAEQLRIAVSLVQNIDWGFSNKTLQFGHNEVPYSRYPYEVLYENRGVCGEKSELLAFLLRELGFDVALFYNQFENHESVGVRCPKEHSWHNSGYCFIETSGPSVISDSSIIYVGGLIIKSKPELIYISDGASLGEDIYEYQDAEDLGAIRQKVEETGKLNQIDISKLNELKTKYGLVDEYNSG